MKINVVLFSLTLTLANGVSYSQLIDSLKTKLLTPLSFALLVKLDSAPRFEDVQTSDQIDLLFDLGIKAQKDIEAAATYGIEGYRTAIHL